jgi:hypothetical protein
MPGVTIGDDAIVAGGAVVTKNVAPGDVVAGVPASTISNFLELDGRRSVVLQTRRTFGPEYAGSHLSLRRIEALRAASLESGYFLRDGDRSSDRDDVRRATADPNRWP